MSRMSRGQMMEQQTGMTSEEEARKKRIEQGKKTFQEYKRNRRDRNEDDGDYGEAQYDELQLIEDIIKRECYDQDFFDGWNEDTEGDFSQNYNGEYDSLDNDEDCGQRPSSTRSSS
tara:strand:- start:478 stop:825 length:348 start_codon:yes stop_codon:yes gene_type:complete